MRPTHAVVITCAQAPERLAAFCAGWAQLGLGLQLDVHTAQRDDRQPWRGCWQSHLAVLAGAVDPVLILEDDAVLLPGFTVDVPGYWDLCFYGEHTEAYVAGDPQAVAERLGAPSDTTNMCAQLRRRLDLVRYFVHPRTACQRGKIGATP